MAGDLVNKLTQVPVDSREFANYLYLQVLSRNRNESAIIEVGADGIARTAAMIDPDNRDAKSRLSKEVVSQLDAGEDVVVVRRAGRIEATTRMPGSRRAYLYVSRDFNVPGFQQSQRASTVLADYNSLFDRSRSEENTSEIQSLMRNPYAGFWLKN